MNDVTFIITCKGRLHHLRETLPRIVAQVPRDIIVVDYACPDKVGDWVENHFPSVQVVRVNDAPGFNVSRARNIGAGFAQTDWLCFIDADIKISEGFVPWMQANLTPGHFYRASLVDGVRDKETWGTTILPRVAFDRIGGYDEAFEDWGGEDCDCYDQLRDVGLTETDYPHLFVEPIHHDDAQRMTYFEVKDKSVQIKINAFYKQAKRYVMSMLGLGRLSLLSRIALMRQIKKQMVSADGTRLLSFSILRFTLRDVAPDDAAGRISLVRFNYSLHRRRYIWFGPRKIGFCDFRVET